MKKIAALFIIILTASCGGGSSHVSIDGDEGNSAENSDSPSADVFPGSYGMASSTHYRGFHSTEVLAINKSDGSADTDSNASPLPYIDIDITLPAGDGL